MSKVIRRIGRSFAFVLSVILMLACTAIIIWGLFEILLSLGPRTVEVNDSNRQELGRIISEYTDDDGNELLNDALTVEWLPLMHKDRIRITYDGDEYYQFFIRGVQGFDLFDYIKENGTIDYFKSSEFAVNMIKMSACFILIVLSVIFIVKQRKIQEDRAKRDASLGEDG